MPPPKLLYPSRKVQPSIKSLDPSSGTTRNKFKGLIVDLISKMPQLLGTETKGHKNHAPNKWDYDNMMLYAKKKT